LTEVSHIVRVANGTSLAQQYTMPAIPGATEFSPPLLDKIGSVLSNSKLLVGLGALGGGAIGAALGHGSIMSRIGTGALGALAGTALAAGAELIAHRGRVDDAVTTHSGSSPLPTAVKADEDIRVMTFNIHGGLGGPEEHNPTEAVMDDIAATIEREHPDVVLLQEVDDTSLRSHLQDELNELAQRLHPDSAVYAEPNRLATGRGQGVMVMTFHDFTVDNARNIKAPDPYGESAWRRIKGAFGERWNQWIDKHSDPAKHDYATGDESVYAPRSALDTFITTPAGNTIQVLATHLGFVPHVPGTGAPDAGQNAQIPPIVSALDAWSGPTILGGDFNQGIATRFGRWESRTFSSAGMTDAFSELGIRPRDPRRRSFMSKSEDGTIRTSSAIDHMYASEQFSATRAYVAKIDTSVSDHRPVVVDYHLNADSPAA
jgi:endonuclease/exonuclease/phosphatase family metal-dependent hydrolase